MKVLGQFNLGFIIARLGDDLFILDQHACDEKHNFEHLKRTTKIHQQPLIQPRSVEATASEEATILDHLPVFEANGFELTVDDAAPPTHRLKVSKVPFSKSVQFGNEDIHELASILADDVTAGEGRSGDVETIRLPKLNAMFASRACRSAVMIGTALDMNRMGRIVRKMEDLYQPWNCPHGRPTMRHLSVMTPMLTAAASGALL